MNSQVLSQNMLLVDGYVALIDSGPDTSLCIAPHFVVVSATFILIFLYHLCVNVTSMCFFGIVLVYFCAFVFS